MFLDLIAISFLIALLRGGRPQENVGLKRVWLPFAAFLLSFANNLLVPRSLNVPVTILAYGLLLWFMGSNLNNQGLRLILIGIVLNALVIVSNGGRIPVDVAVARQVGVEAEELIQGPAAKHAMLTAESRLAFLGDVIPLPYPVPRVISIGDVFVVLGGFLLIQDLMGKPIDILRLGENRSEMSS